MSGDESGGPVDLVWVSEAPADVVAPSIEALLSTAPIATTTRAADALNTAIEMFAAAVLLQVRDRDAGADLNRKVENETRRTARKDDVLRAAIAVIELDILRPIRNALDANAGETTEAAALRVVDERERARRAELDARATPHTAAVRYYASQQDSELASEVGHRIWYLSECALVRTPEGDFIATSGDWIVRDCRGHLYVLPHVGARRAATSDRPRTALEQFGDAVYNLGQPAGGWSALADKLEAEAAAVNTGDPIADLAKRSTLRDRAAVCRDWGARVYQVMGQRRAVDVGPTRRILVEGIPVEVGVALPVEDLPPPAPSDRPALTTALSEIGRLVGLAAPEDRTDQEAWNVYGNQVGEAVKARVAPVVGDAISLPVSCEYIDNGDTITASIFDADGIYLAGLLPLDVVGVSDRKDPQAEELVARLNATYTAGARVAGDDHFDLVVKNMTADDLQRAQAAVREVASDLQASVTAGMPLEQARAMLGQAREAAEWREDERQPDVGGVEGEDAGGDPGVG